MTTMILALLLGTASTPAPTADTLRSAAARTGRDVGAAVGPHLLDEPSYRTVLAREFSVLEAENVMKFGPIHPRPGSDPSAFDFEGSDRLIEFAKANRMKARGHALIWHNQNPTWVEKGNLGIVELNEAFEGHIAAVVGRYKGRIYAWDVVNEAFADDGTLRHTVWYDRPGIGLADQGTAYIERAFRLARKADPRCKLFYNDYGIETLGPKADAVYEMLKDFRARKVPVDGIGFQCHFPVEMNKPDVLDSIERNFARFAKLGLEIHITELDIRVKDGSVASLQAQADFYGKLTELCMRQPKCKLFQTWGFTDRYSWVPRFFRGTGWALLFDENYQKKPSYDAVLKALGGKPKSDPELGDRKR